MPADFTHFLPEDFEASRAAIRRRLDAAMREAGRTAPVEIVAVSKTKTAAQIEPALAAGHRMFGENRVQEAKVKWPALRARYPDIELHLIGPLQSNKAGEAVALFDVIETVDREKIAAALAREMAAQNRRPRLLVQVNTGGEPQKAGLAPEETDAFLLKCKDEFGLEIEGLI